MSHVPIWSKANVSKYSCLKKRRDASILFNERAFVCRILDRFDFASLGVGARDNSAVYNRRRDVKFQGQYFQERWRMREIGEGKNEIERLIWRCQGSIKSWNISSSPEVFLLNLAMFTFLTHLPGSLSIIMQKAS